MEFRHFIFTILMLGTHEFYGEIFPLFRNFFDNLTESFVCVTVAVKREGLSSETDEERLVLEAVDRGDKLRKM